MPRETIKTLHTDKGPVSYTLQRKKMKTIRVKVEGDEIIASCGINVPQRTVEDFILRQLPWIEDAKMRQSMKKKGILPHLLEDGEVFHYLGSPYTVKGVVASREGAFLQGPVLLLHIKSDDAGTRRKVFNKWVLKNAKEIFFERLCSIYPQFSREIGDMPEITVRSMKTRWGSAHIKKRVVTLNTALVFAPIALIDYVVAHELSHFVHANHSKEYYSFLATHMPDWKKRKTILNKTYSTGF